MIATYNDKSDSPVRVRFWLAAVAQAIGIWGVLMSIIIPFLLRQQGPPETVHTNAARYRLLTPRRPKRSTNRSTSRESKKFGTRFPLVPLVPRAAARVLGITTYDHCPMPGSSGSQFTFYEAAAITYPRSISTDGCVQDRNGMVLNNTEHSSGRTRRDSSTSTIEFVPRRARRSMTITSIVAKASEPVRPPINRARTALRSFSTPRGPACSVGGALGCSARVPRTRMQLARTRTMNAITRTASVATALLTPMPKDNFDWSCSDDESENDESDSDADTAPPSSSSASFTASSIQTRTSGTESSSDSDMDTYASPRQTRPKLATRRFSTFTNMRILSRMQN